jgi:hypothetical protein
MLSRFRRAKPTVNESGEIGLGHSPTPLLVPLLITIVLLNAASTIFTLLTH